MHKKNKALSILGIFLMVSAVLSFIAFYFTVMASQQGYHYIDPETLDLVQTKEIPDGAPIAVIETSLGEIKAVLYPKYAPQTVAQFIELAESGYYDNTYVFEVKNGIYFSAGSTDNDGNLPADLPEECEKVPQELHQNLWPFKGALCAMDTGSDGGVFKRLFKSETRFSGTRFLVVDSMDFTDEEFLQQFREASASDELADAFVERGGVPNFSQQMTVFGQTYEGLDVVEAISHAETFDNASSTGYTPPKEDIMILSVRIESYGKESEN
jgi:peptidyl-prolyl cis-trans isomerase B (cyclophilin B)